MIDLEPNIYACSILLNIDYSSNISRSQKQIRWELWNKFRNKCLGYDINNDDSLIENILQTTYPIPEDNSVELWGCDNDICACMGDILVYKHNIFSPIEVNFEAESMPPLKWCEHMRRIGFMVKCLFVDLDKHDNKHICGECIYNSTKITEEKITVPYDKIDNEHLDKLYEGLIKFNRYKLNIYRMEEYTKDVFNREGICEDLCDLLDLWNVGPTSIASKCYNGKVVSIRLEILETKLETDEINEGEYLKQCNELKASYERNRLWCCP